MFLFRLCNDLTTTDKTFKNFRRNNDKAATDKWRHDDHPTTTWAKDTQLKYSQPTLVTLFMDVSAVECHSAERHSGVCRSDPNDIKLFTPATYGFS